MKKIFILFVLTLLLFFSFSNGANAGTCDNPRNYCLCNPGPSCCDIEGPDGYNCGGGSGGCTASNQCGGGNVCCNGVCVGSGQCGGGGGAPGICYGDTTNCPAGATIALDQPVSSTCRSSWGGGFCGPVGSAQRETACCSGGHADGSCDNPEITTYNCCGAGSLTQCSPSGAAYQRANTCWTPTICNNPNDIYVGNVPNPAGGICNRYCDGELAPDGVRCFGGNWIDTYNVTTTCQPVACTCVASCTPAAPSAPTLTSPADGATVATAQVTLSWNNSSWGTGCPTNNDYYTIYIGTSIATMAPVGSTQKGTGNVTFAGVSGTTYYWKVIANNGSLSASSPIWSFVINVPPAITTPWWQVKDGDVTASNGNIQSSVPAASYFNLDGTGTFPGVPVYSGGLAYNPGLLSSKNWSANTTTTQGRIFDYTYFKNLIPDNVTPTTNAGLLTSSGFSADGYEWFKITGNLSLNAIDFGARKVILFVEGGNLTINGNLNVTDGVGFLGVFVDGNITVRPTVTGASGLEGIYLSDGVFTSEVAATRLHVRGSVASYGGITLGRNLVDDSVSAELFEYAPDQILLFPKKLAYRRTKWAEIAP